MNDTVAQRVATPLLFKVLVDDAACHGGSGQYPPIGEWTDPKKPLCCESGWHLTSDPLRWWKPGATLWLCEPELPLHGDGSDKAAFLRVRRICEITHTWPFLPMLPRIRCFLAASQRSKDKNADISWSNLSRSNLSWSNLSGSDLSGSDLSRSNLSGSNLSGSNLSGSDLSGSNLSWSDLSWSNLSGSDLSWSNLSWSNLSGSDLSRSNLSWSNLSGAYRPTDPPNGYRPDASGYLQRWNKQ